MLSVELHYLTEYPTDTTSLPYLYSDAYQSAYITQLQSAKDKKLLPKKLDGIYPVYDFSSSGNRVIVVMSPDETSVIGRATTKVTDAYTHMFEPMVQIVHISKSNDNLIPDFGVKLFWGFIWNGLPAVSDQFYTPSGAKLWKRIMDEALRKHLHVYVYNGKTRSAKVITAISDADEFFGSSKQDFVFVISTSDHNIHNLREGALNSLS